LLQIHEVQKMLRAEQEADVIPGRDKFR
jgi:hypothetical protein